MGFSFCCAGCGNCVEECRDESDKIKINGSSPCGKVEEKLAGVKVKRSTV